MSKGIFQWIRDFIASSETLDFVEGAAAPEIYTDLIYTANVYGPVQFDEGEGTPIAAIQSWMQYKALADAQGINLVRNAGNTADTLLAWAPVTTTAA